MTVTRVERWDAERDGPLSETALQRKIESRGFVVRARTYPAMVAAAAPAEDVAGLTGVVRGLVKITMAGEQTLLTAGDIVFIPPGAVRTVELTGPSTALCLEATQRPGSTLPDAADSEPSR